MRSQRFTFQSSTVAAAKLKDLMVENGLVHIFEANKVEGVHWMEDHPAYQWCLTNIGPICWDEYSSSNEYGYHVTYLYHPDRDWGNFGSLFYLRHEKHAALFKMFFTC